MTDAQQGDPLKFEGEVRTDFSCTECGKGIIAQIDYSLNGNHVVECPHCGHEHCRVITDGKITGDRWSTRQGTDKDRDVHKPRYVWKSADDVLQRKTSSYAEFMRQRWLEKRDM